MYLYKFVILIIAFIFLFEYTNKNISMVVGYSLNLSMCLRIYHTIQSCVSISINKLIRGRNRNLQNVVVITSVSYCLVYVESICSHRSCGNYLFHPIRDCSSLDITCCCIFLTVYTLIHAVKTHCKHVVFFGVSGLVLFYDRYRHHTYHCSSEK
jgi:hypothetical protein